jgi:hypothetical protein
MAYAAVHTVRTQDNENCGRPLARLSKVSVEVHPAQAFFAPIRQSAKSALDWRNPASACHSEFLSSNSN